MGERAAAPVLRARDGEPIVVSQFVADLAPGDAVSDDCLAIDVTLRRWGIPTGIYAGRVQAPLASRGFDIAQHRPAKQEIILFHYTLWSAAAEYVLGLEAPIVLIYHNITPSVYFAGVNPQAEHETRHGRAMLAEFRTRTVLALGDSEYNRRELVARGFEPTGILPILIDHDRIAGPVDPAVQRALADGKVNILTVGRIAPNKRQDDVIRVFAVYHRRINPASRLLIVGSPAMAAPYADALRRLVDRLGLGEAVHFAGHIPAPALRACYQAAHVYLCLSEHEGFCVPLVEAMALGIPVVAYAATAVPETLGDAGILLHRKDPVVAAEVIDLVVRDGRLRAQLIGRGKARAAAFARPRVEAMLAAHLRTACERSGLPAPTADMDAALETGEVRSR